MPHSRSLLAAFWVSTLLFALEITFTAYAQLRLPQVAAAFVHMGFPAYFRVELACAKFAGIAAILIPAVPPRVKEWAYAGFAITLVSALIAHFAMGESVQAWGFAAATSILWLISYISWRRLYPGQLNAASHTRQLQASTSF